MNGRVCDILYKTINRLKQRFWLQQHARPTTKRPVVHRAMTVVCVITQVVDTKLKSARFARPLDNTLIKRPREHPGEQGQHINFHGCPKNLHRPLWPGNTRSLVRDVVLLVNNLQPGKLAGFGTARLHQGTDGIHGPA